MNWVERLNRTVGTAALGGGAVAEIQHWAYSPHLPDNVPHRHTYFEVCLVGRYGSGYFLVEGTPLRIGPGDLFIARPGIVHQIVNDPGGPLMELFWVAFHGVWAGSKEKTEAEDLFRAFAGADRVLVAPDREGSIAANWGALRAAAGGTAADLPGSDAVLQSLTLALLTQIAQRGSGEPTPPLAEEEDPGSARLARRALRFVQDNLGRPISVEEIARTVDLSPRHLSRLFVRFTGVGPAAYVEQARLDRARTLLLRTDDPIKQVAALVGYADVHHFTRAFSRRFGCPPGRYRETRGASDQTPRGPDIRIPGALV